MARTGSLATKFAQTWATCTTRCSFCDLRRLEGLVCCFSEARYASTVSLIFFPTNFFFLAKAKPNELPGGQTNLRCLSSFGLEEFTGVREHTLTKIQLKDITFIWMQSKETGSWVCGVLLDYRNLKYDKHRFVRRQVALSSRTSKTTFPVWCRLAPQDCWLTAACSPTLGGSSLHICCQRAWTFSLQKKMMWFPNAKLSLNQTIWTTIFSHTFSRKSTTAKG